MLLPSRTRAVNVSAPSEEPLGRAPEPQGGVARIYAQSRRRARRSARNSLSRMQLHGAAEGLGEALLDRRAGPLPVLAREDDRESVRRAAHIHEMPRERGPEGLGDARPERRGVHGGGAPRRERQAADADEPHVPILSPRRGGPPPLCRGVLVAHCRFRTSNGGTKYCSDPPYEEGFCRFHYDCYLRGELLQNGQINELLSDQNRRRVINFHGIDQDARVYADGEPLVPGA